MSERGAEELLVHAGWLRALAVRLVHDRDDADDLVQDTWMATMRRGPERTEGTQSWLAKVLLNRLRMRVRSDGRRTAREQATVLLDDEVPNQDVVVARAEMQRKLVELVLELDEPYRTTVLLHYCEGVPLATIARTQGIAASTVRWRLKTALDQLREGLDGETRDRKHWVGLLAIPKGVLVAQKTTKLIAVAIVLLLLIAGGLWITRHRESGDGEPATASSGSGRGDHGTPTGSGAATPGAAGAAGADPDRPAWLIQGGVAARRIAGRVVFDGAPVAGATVELASLATESGLGAPRQRTTSATGEFDFGLQPAMEFSVRASAPHLASAVLTVDLRSPIIRPDHLELALGACDAAMVGTVRDASGGAIAKARIARLDLESQGNVPGGPAVIADDEGRYEMCVETRFPPNVTVEVSAAGYGTIVFTGMVPGRVTFDFALVPEATVVGRVIRDDTREPVAQAYVYIPAGPRGNQRTGWRATFTDASGTFRIDRLAPGNHLVFARAEGLADAVHGVPVSVEGGQTSVEIEIRLEAGSTIRGTVVDGTKPVAGARVATRGRIAYSQDDGSFVLTSVPRGEAEFTALPYDVVEPQKLVIDRALLEGVVLEVVPLGTITGRVERKGKPVAGADVYLKGPSDHELDPVFTGTDGRFVARGLRPGPWRIDAGSQRLGAFGLAPAIVQLARGQTADVTIDMAYAAAISGRVIDQTGAAVPGVTVQFTQTAADDVGFGVTSADGSFRATTMSGGGQYRPSVNATAGGIPTNTQLRPAAGGEFPLVTLADGTSDVTGIVLAVRLDRLAIAGIVVDGDGAPVPDARVIAELVEGNAEPRFFPGVAAPASTTDVDGHFTIDNLLAGTYAVRARSAAGSEGTLLGVRAGRKDLQVVLPSPGTLEATLAGFATSPQVTAQPTGANRSSAPVPGIVQGTVATFRSLSPGSYVVTARAPHESASAIVDVIERKTARVTLASHGSAVVAGRVHDFRTDKPIEGMTCRALSRIGMTASSAVAEGVRTDARGAFVLDAPAGDIAVRCDGLWWLYSDGVRTITLAAAQRLELDVPVVAWRDEQVRTIASIGADLDPSVLVPRLVRVQPGGPAATAGLVDGDTITAVDEASVAELGPDGVEILIVNRPPGTTVKLTVTRAGKPIAAAVVLAPTH